MPAKQASLAAAQPRWQGATDEASSGKAAVKQRTAARLAWSVWATTLALLAGALVLAAANQGARPRLGDDLGLAFAFLCFATVGAFIASRRHANAVGWICCVIGLTVSLAVAPIEYGHYALAHPGSLPAAATLAWPAMWAYNPALGLMAMFLLLLFPTGHLPSRRWRPVAWAAGATITGMTLVAAVAPVPPDDGLPTNPLGIQQLARAWELTESIGALLFGALAVASAASLVVRFRHARGEERQQLKWFSFGTGGLVVLLAIQAAAPTLGARVPNLVVAAALGAIPLAIGIAILRYRLYDIDRIINRTLVYGLLTAVLGGGYAGAVLVLGQFFGGVTSDPPSWVVAGATLAVAALFRPTRRRIQQAVDRSFNRRKYNATTTIQAFSTRLRGEIDLDTLSSELLAVVDQTMEPTRVSFWLRPSPPGSSGAPHSEARPSTWAY
jgi:hypothetical protein